MMSRKVTYNSAKVSSPTTSDGSNSSADNNYNSNNSNNNSGSPGRSAGQRAGGMHSLAEYHQDFQLKIPQQQQQQQLYSEEPVSSSPNPGTPARPRVYLHSISDSTLSRSGVYSKSGSGGPAGYHAGAEGGSLPTSSLSRSRDTPEQVSSLVSSILVL